MKIATKTQRHKETPRDLLLKKTWYPDAPDLGGKNFHGLRVRAFPL
jgi:hypothetical protein